MPFQPNNYATYALKSAPRCLITAGSMVGISARILAWLNSPWHCTACSTRLTTVLFSTCRTKCYVHKMLTGRAEAYLDESRFGEVTGFTNPLESEHDSFVLGHTGTSISLACGLAKKPAICNALQQEKALSAMSYPLLETVP